MNSVDTKLGEFGADISTLKTKVEDLDGEISHLNTQLNTSLNRLENRLTRIEIALSSKQKSDMTLTRLAWALVISVVASLVFENDIAMTFIKGVLK